ncbi:Cys/Met metabolism pyridoxal-phosphate-dependent enzyme [Gonapodya prolifera JEL478]|uniref:Cys/Met metabolism pyridoxal-phosphate-dependent enzyme n=1 Tax=Gonapodya prolifera (strain JEL478) TaxID=1344416 RepID=A0A139A1R0_GONPJ|nr:Cys/Met metabolism pyridoxal-phosphate-dependent enzyme [Gonapodya prolifera JEL478]|eukprot:KXS10730.1 Cys/Met metabolism pyridoxal-phosphate-dependent enzyme [Gonapodya prolifera JEL478]
MIPRVAHAARWRNGLDAAQLNRTLTATVPRFFLTAKSNRVTSSPSSFPHHRAPPLLQSPFHHRPFYTSRPGLLAAPIDPHGPIDPLPPLRYSDDMLRSILSTVRTIAMVGVSSNWNRPSYFVMKYLQDKGCRVIPVNPGMAGKELLGERVYARLEDIPEPVDMVDIFRASSSVPPIVSSAIAIGARVVWMQLGVRNDTAALEAQRAGLVVVMDRCPKIEFGRLGGELSWQGVNSGIVSSKRFVAPREKRRKVMWVAPEAADGVEEREPGFATRAVHAGVTPDPTTGARTMPIYQTTSYVFDDVDHAASLFNLHTFGYIYSRLTNPTVSALEERIASLEGGRAALCSSSGHAAQFLTFFTLLEPGDEFVASQNLYGGSITQFKMSFPKLGWKCTFFDPDDMDSLRRVVTEKTKAVFIESLSNPGGVVVDIEACNRVTQEYGIPLIVDNTLATPYLCQPFKHGADLVVHSTTKFLSGHGNSLGGCIVESGKFNWAKTDKFPSLTKPESAYHGLVFYETFGDFAFTTKARAVALRDFGPTMAPFNAFLTMTGIETLHLRMERHCANAKKVAEFLQSHAVVAWVSYAGLAGNKYTPLVEKYLPKGAGSVFTFGVKGGFENGTKVVESVNVFSHLANIGDTRSLILHPASTTHRQLTEEQQIAAGAGPDVIRLSIGIEDVDDLIADLDQALKSCKL